MQTFPIAKLVKGALPPLNPQQAKATIMPKTNRSKREKEITIRLTQEELDQLNARKPDMPTATWIRNLALSLKPIRQVDANLIRALGRIGSNLNQLTKHANTQKTIDQQVLNEIQLIRQLLDKLIENQLK